MGYRRMGVSSSAKATADRTGRRAGVVGEWGWKCCVSSVIIAQANDKAI
jgi:hypothetical protein